MPKKNKNPKKNKSSFKRHSEFILLLIGFLAISSSLILKAHNENNLSFSEPIPIVKASTSIPEEIIIPSLEIHLPIGQTVISNGKWSIYKDGVSHLSTSANPNSNGNIIMYAHNTQKRFGDLKKIKKGNKIILINADGHEKEYIVTQIQTVNPNQVELLLPTDTEILTVYTCTGFADSKRLVVRANPIKS